MNRGIIDIGTNTAHLLIGSIDDQGHLTIITKKRHYTFLGEDGLDNISLKAIQRLKTALDDFEKLIKQHDTLVHIIATEGLRSAQNSSDITDLFSNRYKWPYSIISGDQEASYIHRGARMTMPDHEQTVLVMDIGGGSVEFILDNGDDILYQESHPIGISRLYEKYHQSDPISFDEIDQMYTDLDFELESLWNQISQLKHRPLLIGCAGTFEVLLNAQDHQNQLLKSAIVPVQRLLDLLSSVVHKSIDERKIVPDLPAERANYIVVALLLMNYIVKKLGNATLMVSKYALKEGAIMDNLLFLD